MKKLFFYLLSAFISVSTIEASNGHQSEIVQEYPEGFHILDIPGLNEALQDVSLEGTLCYGCDENEPHLLYLKVDDRFFEALLPLINHQGVDIGSSTLGAHISVMRYSMGDTVENMNALEEIGQQFTFKVKYLATVKPVHDVKWERVWFLDVESPELEALRLRNGLTSKLHNNEHDFHITIATKLYQ